MFDVNQMHPAGNMTCFSSRMLPRLATAFILHYNYTVY